ncbi:hypothetical protein IE53DRAFT_284245 [Violaceomyces palustris]|uniref:Uncharacterized protein n=1 Tax=Violaceomyces palustris TaxID=1673888 RepID=A0ACD0P2Z5_9BASI|nr:hypothetical protein IE53DRAFT_284245 [Violaceomyces palustris]
MNDRTQGKVEGGGGGGGDGSEGLGKVIYPIFDLISSPDLPNRVRLAYPRRPEDDIHLFRIRTSPSVMGFIPKYRKVMQDFTLAKTTEQRIEQTADPDRLTFTAFDDRNQEEQRYIGNIGFHGLTKRGQGGQGERDSSGGKVVEVGIVLSPWSKGKGYVNEVMFNLLDFGFRGSEEGGGTLMVRPSPDPYRPLRLFPEEWQDRTRPPLGFGVGTMKFATSRRNQAMRYWLEVTMELVPLPDDRLTEQEKQDRRDWGEEDALVFYELFKTDWDQRLRSKLEAKIRASAAKRAMEQTTSPSA